jgi:hypothetical protein
MEQIEQENDTKHDNMKNEVSTIMKMYLQREKEFEQQLSENTRL